MSRTVLILIAALSVIGANGLALSPIARSVGAGLEASAAQVLQATAAYGLSAAFAALLLAPQVDRIGADRTLRAALTLLALSLAACAAAPGLWVFWLAQGVSGLATGVALPATYALAAQIAPPGAEGRTMGRVLSGWTIALVLGVTGAALISDLIGWRWVYGGLAFGAVGVALSLSGLGTAAPRGRVTSPLTALRVPGIGAALAAMGALMLAFYLCYTYIGAHVTGPLERTTTIAGLVSMIYGVGFGLGTMVDPLLDRFGQRRAAAPVFAATVLLYLGMAAAQSGIAALMVVALLWGVTQHAGLTLAMGRLTALDPPQRGAILGLSSTVTYLAVFGGASLGGAIFIGFGFVALPVIGAALLLAMTLEAAQR